MNRRRRLARAGLLPALAALLLSVPVFGAEPPAAGGFREITPGLAVGEFVSPLPAAAGDGRIWVVRIDPRLFAPVLLSAAELGIENLDIRAWSRRYGLAAAVNAGMFAIDYRTHVGYQKNRGRLHNPRAAANYKSYAAFDPRRPGDPPFRIFDAEEASLADLHERFDSLVQNLRLIRRPGRNTWPQQEKRWSEAALGEDASGHALLLFSRAPHSMHDFNRILLSLPIALVAAQHLEGGPEASLFLEAGSTRLALNGSYETGFREADDNASFWPLPNVLGFKKAERRPPAGDGGERP